ncbi:hydrogenase maturation nickel metallochaperone HypA/HybF [Arthrobacter bambusae]|uniref:hydrogenase maturation nickel metallochaperone HypA/HybF n=1 Tax=Arthrobacter bambusae TaxID=1338426 RepID=UPI00277EE8AF|nr:hydrogenase maturation nickel metallochaperone HypA [Arthrobacter bambusae]MDQ0213147.1 hydrogenase nickel incorporation protein HypA/HybF [Arthrobacter bambusae]MDQ0237403.1 hydrogenase nickel incorporation protein HypA/HybF [Arthrobacter bambusae]
MHELSITQSLVDAVLERTGERTVIGVNLRIGSLSGVLPDAMRFCFDIVSAGTSLAGAQLKIDEPRGLARCRSCGTEFELADLILLCPCGSADVEVLSGRELMVTSVEVA